MLNEETKRKLRLMNLAPVIDIVDQQDSDVQTVALPFDQRFQRIVDFLYQEKYNEKVKRLVKSARLRFPKADVHDIYYSPNRKINRDIMNELEKPGRDPREQIEEFEFDSSVQTIEDLHEGMELPGIVTNITNFGAFVDIGVHQDGLVHVSQMANKYVKDPTQVVRLHQHVRVRVIAVDLRRQRISLSMKGVSGN